MAHLFKRGRIYYLMYYVAGRQKEQSLRTPVLQIAKEKQRQFESAWACGQDNPLPTRTPVSVTVHGYVEVSGGRRPINGAWTAGMPS